MLCLGQLFRTNLQFTVVYCLLDQNLHYTSQLVKYSSNLKRFTKENRDKPKMRT